MMQGQLLPCLMTVMFIIHGVKACGRDRAPPKISCPEPIHKLNDLGQDHAVVDYRVSAKDNSGHYSLRKRRGYSSGSAFPGGTTTVTYVASDNAKNEATCSFDVIVNLVRCVAPEIQNGYAQCFPSALPRRGTTCRFGCYNGYGLPASVQAGSTTCTKVTDVSPTGQWLPPHPDKCQPRTCRTPELSAEVEETCSNGYSYPSICHYKCPVGFIAVPSIRICDSHGQWIGEKVFCKDRVRPVITSCPSDIVTYLGPGRDVMTVEWSGPLAVDNLDGQIEAVEFMGRQTSGLFSEGRHKVTFKARDAAGNNAIPCSFFVFVQRLYCPPLPPSQHLEIMCTDGAALGSYCTFTCAAGRELHGDQSVTCEQPIHGDYPFPDWGWVKGRPKCKGYGCAPLRVPKHGAVFCDNWLGGKFCYVKCNHGYTTTLPDVIIVCMESGKWTHDVIPDCVESHNGRGLSSTIQSNVALDDCCDVTQQEDVTKLFLSLLQKTFYLMCENCSVSDITVRCKPKCDVRRYKRDVTNDIEEGVITAEVVHHSIEDPDVIYDKTSDIFNDVTSGLENLINNSMGNMTDDGDVWDSTLFRGVWRERTVIQCANGFVKSSISLSCSACQKGTYMAATGECVPCPTGSYQNSTGATSCIRCPDGWNTSDPGSSDQEQCLAPCEPGFQSPTGFVPCVPCPHGSYSGQGQSRDCIPCPRDTWTLGLGNNNVSSCQSFDVNLHVGNTTGQLRIRKDLKQPLRNNLFLTMNIFFSGVSDSSKADVSFIQLWTGDNKLSLTLSIGSRLSIKTHSGYIAVLPDIEHGWQTLQVLWNKDFLSLAHARNVISENCDFPENITSETLHLQIGNHKMEPDRQFVEKISDLGVYSGHEERLYGLDSELVCGDRNRTIPPIISWRDVAASNEKSDVFLDIPSRCDDYNECKSSPCKNGGTCVEDEVISWMCVCVEGYTGSACDVSVDDCARSVCQGGGTCIDGHLGYTCNCSENRKGELCEEEIVSGGWSDWTEWGRCSVTCGGGVMTRTRDCTNPPPDPEGQPCPGSVTETQLCGNDSCPFCFELAEPDNARLACEGDSNARNCSLTCDEGHTTVAGSTLYACGPETQHYWSHVSDFNPDADINPCAAYKSPPEISLQYEILITLDLCLEEILETVNQSIITDTSLLGCVVAGTCTVNTAGFSCIQGGYGGQDDHGGLLVITLNITVPRTSEQTGSESFLELIRLEQQLRMKLLLNGYAVKVGDDVIYYNVTSVSWSSRGICDPGLGLIDVFCVECLPGYYGNMDRCLQCPHGNYQPSLGSATCQPCPPGRTTQSTGAADISQCNVICHPGTYARGTSCLPCPPMTFQDKEGQGLCVPCPDNHVTDGGALTEDMCKPSVMVDEGPAGSAGSGAATAAGVVLGLLALAIVFLFVGFFILKKRRTYTFGRKTQEGRVNKGFNHHGDQWLDRGNFTANNLQETKQL